MNDKKDFKTNKMDGTRKLFLKLLTLLPRDSDGLELAEYGITWSVYESSSGLQGLVIRLSGLEIHIMMSMEEENYLDETTRREGSFEALVFRAVQAVCWRGDYSEYDHIGKLGTLGVVRYVLYKDLATIANEIIDAENLSGGAITSYRNKGSVQSNTKAVGMICRKVFRFPVYRTGNGWVVVLDEKKIAECKMRYGFEE